MEDTLQIHTKQAWNLRSLGSLLVGFMLLAGCACPAFAEETNEDDAAPSFDPAREVEPVRGVSWPQREGMVFALDPGLAVRMNEPIMLYGRFHLRIGHCLTEWVSLEADAQLDLLMVAFDKERSIGGPKLVGLGATFFAIEGWSLRVATGMDVTTTNVVYASGRTGYEWATERKAAVGFAVTGTALWDVPDSKPDWLMGLTLTLTAYDLFDRFWMSDDGFR